MKCLLLAAAAALTLGSAAAAQTPVTDLTGRQMTVVDAGGARTTIRFEAEGVARVRSPAGEETGRWTIADQQLCFEFESEAPDCWPWDGSMPEGRAVPAAHADGRAVLVTLEPATPAAEP